MYIIIDTYSQFSKYWEKAKHQNIRTQVDLWLNDYMTNYKELLKLLLEDYEKAGIDWKEIAANIVFPKIKIHAKELNSIRKRLLQLIPITYNKFTKFWGIEIDIVFVIYVGLYCGAGWAYEYKGKRAVLLDLIAIADLEWTSEEFLEGLLLHELTHLMHGYLRNLTPKQFEKLEEDAVFLLYSEGYATRGEHLILNREIWRMASNSSWLTWCRNNTNIIAKEYLKRIKEGKPVNDFFGSWLNFKGKSQVGYYLGHEFIKTLERKYDFKEIATLPLNRVRSELIEFLGRASGEHY